MAEPLLALLAAVMGARLALSTSLTLVWDMHLFALLQKQNEVWETVHLLLKLVLQLLLAVCADVRLVQWTPMAKQVLLLLNAPAASLSTMILLSAYVVKLVSMNKSNNIPPTTTRTKRNNYTHLQRLHS